MHKVGIIGYGYWGPNLARNFATSRRFELAAVCDLSDARREHVSYEYPSAQCFDNVDAFLSSDLDAVAIATPISTHFGLIEQVLAAGKHVLVEKPMCATVPEAEKIVATAKKSGRVVLVDHTFMYTSAVRKLRALIDEGHLGDLFYYDSVRINLGLFQHDVNVLWDLAPHDVSILLFLLHKHTPLEVSATGMSHTPTGVENIAYINVQFTGNVNAHCHENWLAPTKVRTTIIGGSQRMVIFDDNEPIEKIKIFDKGIDIHDSEEIYKARVSYRTGDIFSPYIDRSEALQIEVQHFADCIEGKDEPFTSVRDGFNVVKILEEADASMRKGGAPGKVKGFLSE